VNHHRADLDQRAYELRQQGLTYRAIAKWLGVTLPMAPGSSARADVGIDRRVSRAASPELCLASPR
jgi:hypothetical protein